MIQLTSLADGFNKPFNPLLGETYELQTDEFRFIAEQVSHHPPITAWYVEAKNKSYRVWSQFENATKFTGQFLCLSQKHPTFVELENGEVYQILTPVMSAHNLIMGTPYLDIGETACITRMLDA